MPAAARTPSGTMLENGYQTIITFANDETVALWEKTVQPPGIEGGDKIDVTTMHNINKRTYAARSLTETTDGQMTVGYDPAVITDIEDLVNIPQDITVTHPDGSTWVEPGYMKNFSPSANSEGAMPEATCTFVFTNRNPTTGAEVSKSYTAPPVE